MKFDFTNRKEVRFMVFGRLGRFGVHWSLGIFEDFGVFGVFGC